MRIHIMTDLEGVCGVTDFENWCGPGGRYYEAGRELLTGEVNAAVEGFLAAGAREILVADGHGGGAIDRRQLHPAAELARNWNRPPYPFLMDSRKFDGVAWVGQHAMSGSLLAHLAHTGTTGVCEDSINGIPLGEFGVLALCAGELGLPVIFGSGDRAFTGEAQALAPGLETVAVQQGLTREPGYHLPSRAYARHTLAAVHIGVEAARAAIRTAAGRAGERLAKGERFSVVKLRPPYRRVTVFRSDEENPPRISINEDPESIIALLNQPRTLQVLDKADPRQFV